MLVERFEQQAARSGIPWSLAVSARCRGLLLAARGELDAAADALERALREHDAARCRSSGRERCSPRARCGAGRSRSGRRGRRSSRRAELFERLGADAWARARGDELQRVAARAAPDELTPTELQIARLAATA